MSIPFNAFIGVERVRGFQPPWHLILIYKCKVCGQKYRIRKSWTGPIPRGALGCKCDERRSIK